MKHMRKTAGISILLTLIFMITALFRYQTAEEMPLLPEQTEIVLNENWTMALLEPDEAYLSESWMEQPDEIGRRFEAAQKQGKCENVSLPHQQQAGDGSMLVFKHIVPAECTGLTLQFYSEYATAYVVLDGEMIYHLQPEEIREKDDLAVRQRHYVDLPNVVEVGEIYIALQPLQTDTPVLLGEASMETRDLVLIGLVGNSIMDIGCCLLIVIMAIIMFVLALIRRYTGQPSRGEIYLGLAGFAAGIYCFIGTDTLSIFYNMDEAYEMQEYLVLLLPVFWVLYLEHNLKILYPRRFSMLLGLVSVHAVGQIFFHLSGIRELKDMVDISVAVIVTVCVTAIVSLVQYDYQNKSRQTTILVLGMLVLLSGAVANILMNIFFDRSYVNIAGQYSMTVFGILMAVTHVLQISKEYRADAEERVRETRQQNIWLEQAKHEAETARQEALAANEAKGKFLAHMSHEIRTPINAVLGMDEMILRESTEQNIKEYAMDIYTAGQTLLSLINDILDFSKIESGKMEIVPVEYDFSSMIHDLANMATQRASDKNIRLEVEADHEIPSGLCGDDVRIRQVLTNILTNAVKYTPQGTVWLRVRVRSKMDETVVLHFEVEDTGIGIKEEDLPKLFAEFERIEEDRNRNIEGTGLGMSITIQLLALLGSRLEAESVYGQGSRFSFDLEQKVTDHTPIGDFETRVRQLAETYHYHTAFCAPDAHILVVDDNAVNRKVLRNLLKDTQVHVTDAGGGAECLQLVQKNHYDLIFLDHMMPEMDGIETLHRFRALSDFPCQHTPVVVLTANAVSGAREKYLSEGFDDFLSKPVVPKKLEQMIQKMLPKELMHEAVLKQQEQPDSSESFLEELPQVDGLDWQYAWMHLPDKDLLAYTCKEFYAQIASAAERLEQEYEQIARYPESSDEQERLRHLDAYRIQVHAMKSLAASVGMVPLSGLAKILEYAARDAKAEEVLSITPVFLEEWRSCHEKLHGVFGIGEEQKQAVTDVSVIRALVEMVRISMQEMDIDQADALVSQLRSYEYPQETERLIQKLADAVTNLDAEDAERLADLLSDLLSDEPGAGRF